jgi:hypothetical protein
LAAVCFLLFATLNVVHYSEFDLVWPFANAPLWLDIRTLTNSILINLMAAYVFFLLIVHLPTIREREVMRNNLRSRYHDFKTATISHFLGLADGSYQFDLVEKLCDIRQFRDYFKEDNSARWDAIANALDGDRFRMNEILVELAILRAEVSFVLTKIEIRDEQVLAFFKNMSSTMYRLEHGDCEYDDVKSMMQFMWQLFAGWSWVKGYAEEDVVQKLIEKI